jgi:periplasmic protein CpxP/Spy
MKKLFFALCLLPLAAIAHPGDKGDKPGHCDKHGDKHGHQMKHKKAGDMPFYLRGIELTDAQKAQVKALMEKRHQDRQATKGEHKDIMKAIHELTRAETLNEAELERLIDKSLDMKKQAAMDKARFHHEIYQLLTEEQRQQLDEKMAAFKEKHKKHKR